MAFFPIEESWARIEHWLEVNAPGNFARLNQPAEASAITAAEERLGRELPEDLKTLLLLRNGTNSFDSSGTYRHGAGFLPTMSGLLPVESIPASHEMNVESCKGS